MSENESKTFNKIISREADVVDFQRSLKKLSEYLHRYHKEKTLILIDEYDTPIQAGFNKFYGEAIAFMRNLLGGAFKDNQYLYKGIITGILRVSKESIFTGLNNISVYSITNYGFSDKFGFTEKETKQILADFNFLDKFNTVKQWYNGYRFGETENIYNPWSILNYVTTYREGFNTFWVNTSSDELLKDEINKKDANIIREEILKLINNETIEKEIEENFVFLDMETDKELLWTLLAYSGYLTINNKLARKKYGLKIPNYEIKTVFQDIIIKWLKTEVKIRRNLLDDTAKHLTNNELYKFEQGFRQIMGDTFSYFDTAKTPEFAFQSYILGLLASIGDEYIIRSNRESGEGRYDIVLIPHDKTRHGVVIEIKRLPVGGKVKTGHALSQQKNELPLQVNAKINEALEQIEQNKYYNELLEHKIKPEKIIKVPIVFVGKVPYVNPVKGV